MEETYEEFRGLNRCQAILITLNDKRHGEGPHGINELHMSTAFKSAHDNAAVVDDPSDP